MKRFLLLITVVLLLVLLCAVSVSAAETEQIRTGLVPALRLDPVTPEDPVKEVFKTKEEAAAHIREHLKARDESFNVYYYSEYSVRREDLEDLMAEALKHTGDPKAGDSLSWQLEEWQCQTKAYTYYGEYEINFEVKYYTTAEQEAELDAAVANVLQELDVESKTSYEKILAVYDYICKNITYDYVHLEDTTYMRKHTAYAALVDKTAVCQGYALLLYRMLLELGVENRLVVGISGDENHAWNIVEIDGLHYNLDATWDAGKTEYDYFLRCEENFENHVRYLEYETFSFHERHPMGVTDYKPGENGKVDPIIGKGSCGKNAFWELRRDKSLTISGSGAIYDYEYLSGFREQMPPWEYWEAEIVKLVIEEGITQLGECNFCDMAALKSVSLPSTLKKISKSCFAYASTLERITIPENVTTIEDGVFRNCFALAQIDLPDGVTQIGAGCFYGCKALKAIRLSAQLKLISDNLFSDCDILEQVIFPENVLSIGMYAFRNCFGLTKITIPATVTRVKQWAFDNCENLTEIVFEGSPVFEERAFSGAEETKKKFVFQADAPKFHENTLSDANVICYYPRDNQTWAEVINQSYGGIAVWVASCNGVHVEVKDKAVAATCILSGLKEGSHCAVCEQVIVPQEIVPATGHELVVDPGRAATCTEEGLTDGAHCVVCGMVLADQETISVADHALGEWQIVKEATEAETGIEKRSCSACDYVEERMLEKLAPPTEPATVPGTAATTEPTTAAQPTSPAPGSGDVPRSGGAWILITVMAVLGVGAAAAVVLIKRKK